MDDPGLLDFLASKITQIPAPKYTPQALSVFVSVYAGAHRRRSMTSLQRAERDDVTRLPEATGKSLITPPP